MKTHILKHKLTVLFFICLSLTSISQNEFSKWYFGFSAGLDFSTTPPTAIPFGYISTAEGCATICDGAGNFLFCTDGLNISNSSNNYMANGTGLNGNGTSTQCALIVKQPGNSNIYYVFTVWGQYSYSIVDMNLAAGMGSVTVKNAMIYTSMTEKQVAVRHCNGKDVWLVTHEDGTSNFRSYLLTASGINFNPVITSIGETIAGGSPPTAGHLKISPDGKKLAVATSSNSTPNSLGNGGFQLFDFNAATGVVSNSLVLNTAPIAYGVEFSSDGTKLYGSTSPLSNAVPTIIYQWDICTSSTAAIIASQYSFSLSNVFGGSLQRAIDGKIYIPIVPHGGNTNYLSVINNANAQGAAMGFSLNTVSVYPNFCVLGLPNYINTYSKPAPVIFNNTVACQTSSFAVPAIPTFTSGCTSTPYAPNGYKWDFGEASSGAANTSTASNPAHTYSTLGTYTVSLILMNPCSNDTVTKVVTINIPGPTPAVSGPSSICKGDKNTYTVSGGSSYLWSSGSATTSTLQLSPSTTTNYTVSATTNGCTLSKTFTITVNPCTGIEAYENNGLWQVFPNPFKEVLVVESAVTATLTIFDMNGKLVLETTLSTGRQEINTSQLQAGLYTLQTNGAKGSWHAKFAKVE